MNEVHPHELPELNFVSTQAEGSRHGHNVRLVVVHRWGVRYVDEEDEAKAYHGVINYFKHPKNQVSAHIVYPGSAAPGHATQMVGWRKKAWAEAYYNPDSVEIESADAIWLGHDPLGFHQLARMVGWMLHHFNLPPHYLDSSKVATGKGFCRHADLGALGGGHTSCPTTDMHLWHAFCYLVKYEYHRGGYRTHWGRA